MLKKIIKLFKKTKNTTNKENITVVKVEIKNITINTK